MNNGRKITITLPKKHSGQQSVVDGSTRFNVVNCGRRWGKTLLGVDLTVHPTITGFPVGWFSPTYKMLAEVWRTAKNIYAPITTGKSEQEKRLEIIGGGVLEFWSLDDPDSSRGRKYKRVIIDEAAKARHLQDAWSFVIRQTLADYRGDAWFLSTPKGLNYYHELYSFGLDGRPGWGSWQFSTYDNPFIYASEIDDIKVDLPARVFQQEILAEFLADGAYFQNVDAAASIVERDEPGNHKGHGLYLAIDWGQENDFTVVVVGCQTCNRVVDWDRFNELGFTYQREKVYTLAARWPLAGVMPERNSVGEPNIELFIQRGLPVMLGPDNKPGFYTSATTKPPIIQGLAVALESGGFKVPKDAAHELRIFEIEQMPSGYPRFSAPTNQHDDWVMALAILNSVIVGGGWWIL